MSKIYFILPHLNAGGAERVAINYIRQFDLDEYEVTLVVFEKTADLAPLIPECIELVDLRTRSTSKSAVALINLLRQREPDIVFTTHSRIATLLTFIRPLVPKFRHFARMQNTPSLEKKHRAYSELRRKLYAYGFRGADFVISQTEAMRDDGIDVFGIEPSKIKVLPNPIDEFYINKSVKGLQSPFSVAEVSAVASGRLNYQKGFDVLIAAIPKVLNSYPNFVLYILGNDDGEGGSLNRLVDELKLESHVKFLGFQSNPYLHYAFCNLFILSSRWEGFPNAFLENYYLNTPIVSTKCVPIISEMICEGVNGYLCEPDNAIELSEQIVQGLKLSRSTISNSLKHADTLQDMLLAVEQVDK